MFEELVHAGEFLLEAHCSRRDQHYVIGEEECVERQAFAGGSGNGDVSREFIEPREESIDSKDKFSGGEDIALADAGFLIVAVAKAMVSDDASSAIAVDVHHQVARPLGDVEAL